MSQFNEKLDQAKKRQKKIYLVAGITVLVALLFMAGWFMAFQGTRVEITPEDAKKHARINVVQGMGFSLGDTVYSFGNKLEIGAWAPGYKVSKASIDSAHMGRVFPLELFELPGRLVMDIKRDIPGNNDLLSQTAWKVNDRDVALSEKLDIELESGSYTVSINNPFFLPQTVAVEITPGKQVHEQVDLLPVRGVLNIASTPSGAMVFLDDKKMGVTPLQFEQNGGRYGLRVVLDNFGETTESVSITQANFEVNRNYRLNLKKGRVRLDLTPPGGTLLVNGIKASEPLVLEATIEHRLTYMKTGFYPKTQSVVLKVGEEKQISLHLQPEMGRVEIVSSPQATVWIDGKEVGVSPVSLELLALPHAISVTKPGFRSVVKTITPKGDTPQKISVALMTEEAARLRQAPGEISLKNGIKLKLYLVQESLIMGAPRSETGQRANEFQKNIRLTKPFYASLFEITNDQFGKFDPKKAAGPGNTPVTSISWQEAAAFCNWLSVQDQLSPFYKMANGIVMGFNGNGEGFRLLSEGEWEWLARKAGKKKQTLFVWGDARVIPPKTANVADESARGQVTFFVPNYSDGYAGVAPVGSFDAEPSGLHDMAGNVSEWVHDIYSIVPPSSDAVAHDPLGEAQGHSHVVKGANWRSGTITTLRPAFREGLTEGGDDVGFRIGRYL